LENARAEVEALGGRALVLPTDVADADQVECAAEVVEREFGPIDVWVNNAMATIFAPFDQVTPAEFKRATEVTYLGVVYGTMAGAIGPLRADGWRRALAWSDRGPSSCACAWPPWTRATRWVMPKRHGEKSGCASGSAA
jgi:NAD(P)-dependent dehydrogenase (short-subunit alcohol dehydrogenase family)